MSKPYDATSKELLEAYPADWVACAGITTTARVVAIDADVSTVSAGADKVLRIEEARPWILHLEMQAGHDASLPGRVLLYNVLLNRRHQLPVRSVVLLLKREADRPELNGQVQLRHPGGELYLEFSYQVVRLWQRPLEPFLTGGLGTLPLAPLAQVTREALPEVLRRLEERLQQETHGRAKALLTATFLYLGMRFPPEFVAQLARGVQMIDWRESSFYQLIVAEGEAKGRVDEAKRLLLRLAVKHLGEPDAQAAQTIEAITDLERLESMTVRTSDVSSWQELLGQGQPRRRTPRRKKT